MVGGRFEFWGFGLIECLIVWARFGCGVGSSDDGHGSLNANRMHAVTVAGGGHDAQSTDVHRCNTCGGVNQGAVVAVGIGIT